MGQKIRALDYGIYTPGIHKLRWDGNDLNGKPVSSGTYLYKIIAKSLQDKAIFIDTKKMILMR